MINRILTIVKYSFITILLASCASQTPKETRLPDDNDINTMTTSRTQTAPFVPLDANQQDQLFKAVNLLQKDELKPAERILSSLYKKASSNPHVASNYAVVLYKKNNTEKAKKIAEKHMQNSLSQNLLGLIALDNKALTEAESHFLTAIKLDNKNALAYYNVGLIYDTYHQDLKKAIRFYERYLSLITIEDEETQTWVKELKASL